MEKKSKKSIIIGITSLFLVMLLLVGLTYAYYRTRIIGNDSTDPSISVVSEKLEIKYNDGNSTVNMEGLIEPGFEYTKTFSVENTGDGAVGYVLYLEDVVNEYTRTQDWTYKITCSPNCNGTDGYVEYPELSEKLLENEIASKTTQTYNVTIKYANSEDDQSEDMGATLEGKFNIYSPEYVIDIEGEIEGASNGDYVQINSVKKVSKIVNGKYRLPAVEAGSHTLRVMSKEGTEKGKTTLTINKGTQGISGSTITMDDKSETVTLNITNIASSLGIEITKIKEEFSNPYTKGTLAYQILNDNEVTEPKTIPGREHSASDEAVLAATEGNGGDTYYYRGNVVNNYVTYSGMCWRIVRVMENGDIKITLADRDNVCGTANGYSIDDIDGAFVADPSLQTFMYKYRLNFDSRDFVYKNSDVAAVLKAWAGISNNRIYTYYTHYDDELEGFISATGTFTNEGLDTTKLSTTPNWCIDTTIYEKEDRDEYEEEFIFYGAYGRLDDKTTAKPSLKCASNLENESQIGMLSADEIAFAGGGKSNYLRTNATAGEYWTLSPYLNYSSGTESNLYTNNLSQFTADGYGWDYLITIRPAVVLKNSALLDTSVSGQNGTMDNPYVIG